MGQKDYNNADVETQPHAEQKNLKDFFFFLCFPTRISHRLAESPSYKAHAVMRTTFLL